MGPERGKEAAQKYQVLDGAIWEHTLWSMVCLLKAVGELASSSFPESGGNKISSVTKPRGVSPLRTAFLL